MSKPKILILFYSMYGHIYQMAKEAEASINEAGGEPILKKVQDILPYESLSDYAKQFSDSIKDVPVADPLKDLDGIDGIMIGTPTRYGNMTAQMKFFWDQTIDNWLKGSLIGKPVSFFTSSATQHGGQESTILTSMIPLLHHGCIIVGLPYSNQEQMRIDEITGGSPYGASTIAGGKGERQPSENEKKLIRSLARRLTEISIKLKN